MCVFSLQVCLYSVASIFELTVIWKNWMMDQNLTVLFFVHNSINVDTIGWNANTNHHRGEMTHYNPPFFQRVCVTLLQHWKWVVACFQSTTLVISEYSVLYKNLHSVQFSKSQQQSPQRALYCKADPIIIFYLFPWDIILDFGYSLTYFVALSSTMSIITDSHHWQSWPRMPWLVKVLFNLK